MNRQAERQNDGLTEGQKNTQKREQNRQTGGWMDRKKKADRFVNILY